LFDMQRGHRMIRDLLYARWIKWPNCLDIRLYSERME